MVPPESVIDSDTMKLPRIQYITHPDENFDELTWVHRLHENGVNWIQLRIKEEDFVQRFPLKHFLATFHEIADKMRAVTEALGMLLTINDEVEVARFSNADGLHIGQEDIMPNEALEQLHTRRVLGGTVNSISEIERFNGIEMSYFGVGPFRSTTTKATLKPLLGLEGYQAIIDYLKAENRNVPVYAIGGILASDVDSILATGVYGIAVSGAFFNEKHRSESIRAFVDKIEAYELAVGR
ncbi:MAG: thiamine phosphate synthase [Fluviicola sp.]|nr:thiamine phosphate synthase [Fluviicola sp.]